ncbi:MAG: bifunctional folylpolyglutamate synthase/dihydrofolate synthase, partial [Rhodospirillaceae bacterium]|nr:bifunctional folylpolyglutamate synthase/dihydrofolate synthase [Rhodospirillaceae bacterium]
TARQAGLPAAPAESVEAALSTLASARGQPAQVLICGSLHLAGHILAIQDRIEA